MFSMCFMQLLTIFITSRYINCMYNEWIKYFLSLPAAFIEKAEAQLEKALEVKVTLKRKKSVILGFAGSGLGLGLDHVSNLLYEA